MTRTDAHRPSAINPDDYLFIACDYLGGGIEAMGYLGERQAFRAHMTRTGGKFAEHHNSGSCHICGARAVYIARFYHASSNTYIMTGMDCAVKMEMGDPVLFASFRKRILAGLKLGRGKLKAQRLLEDLGLSAAWDLFALDRTGQPFPQDTAEGFSHRQELIVCDIVQKIVRYGEPSEPQAAYLRKLLQQIAERPILAAKRAAETAAAAPVPMTDQRVKIIGKVLTTRVESNQFGPVTKMLVQHEAGYKLWGSMPSGLRAATGDIIEFKARIQRSDKDDKFGFFSRPTNASVTQGQLTA